VAYWVHVQGLYSTSSSCQIEETAVSAGTRCFMI
jgi:hypothetical protein